MISTHTATCNKSEHQHLCNNTHHRDVSSTQVHTDNGCSRRAFNSSCGSNVCNTYCTSLAECVAQVHYVNDASETIGANTYKDVTTSGNCYRPPSKEMYLQPHIEPSIAPITGIEDTANSYIPPPSPAPNSDRYITGVMSPQSIHAHCLEKYTSYYDGGESGNREAGNFNIHQHSSHEQLHHQQHAAQSYSSSSTSISPLAAIGTGNFTEKYISSMQQCSSKPNSRFRMSDRFREVPAPKLLILNSPSDIVGSEDIYATTTDGPTAHPIRCVPSANFLTQHTPFVTRDTYTYLRSTVHTPVKRYIPTPPNQLPTDLTMQPSNQAQQMQKRCVSNGGSCTAVSVSNCKGQQTATQNINNVPNRIRLKCCKDGSTNTSRVQVANKNISHLVHNMDQRPLHAEYSASTARSCSGNSTDNNNTSYNGTSNSNGSINLKCTTLTGRDTSLIILHDQQFHNSSHLAINSHSKTSFLSSTSSIGVCSSPLSLPSLSLSESPVFAFANNNANIKRMIDSSRSSTTISGIHANNTNTETNNYLKRTPSFEYANTTVVNVTADGRNCSAPVTKMDRANCNNNSVSYSNITTANPSSSTTCMHCNTVRRTTGVHQTTQTTDPISPTPLQQKKDGGDTALTGIDVCNSNFIQTGLDETSFGRAPSTSDCISHSPSNGVGSGDNCGRTIFPNKIDDSSRSSIIIDQVQQQKQGEHIYVSSQKSQQQKKTIIRQSTITEKLEVVGSNLCSQSVSSECHLLQASPIQSSQQQRHSIQQRQQQQPLVKHQIHMLEIQQNQDKIKRCSSKKYFSIYIQKEISRFFGLDESTEAEQIVIWQGRQRRLALRRFGELKNESELHPEITNNRNLSEEGHHVYCYSTDDTISQQCNQGHHSSERPDILSTHQAEEGDLKNLEYSTNQSNVLFADFHLGSDVERKASVPAMIMSSITFLLRIFNKREQSRIHKHCPGRFTPTSTNNLRNSQGQEKFIEGIAAVQEIENPANPNRRINQVNNAIDIKIPQALTTQTNVKRDSGGSGIIRNNEVKIMEHHRQIYISERVHGWRTSAVVGTNTRTTTIMSEQAHAALHLQQPSNNSEISLEQTQGNIFSARTSSSDHVRDVAITPSQVNSQCTKGTRGNRISAELIDNVLDNSLHPVQRKVRLFSLNDVDDRDDHRPFFTYWINTVQILVLLLSVICYGIGPIGIGIEKKTGQVLVNSLSLQTVQHTEQRNIWVGPRNYDLVHLGAKLATCMRNDVRVLDVLLKIRRQERETACCIRNDDSGCVQSSQADCSLRGLFPAKSISTWKKWSAGESGPGGRISGSVCGLDPKYCDTPASVAPYEWPDDITKWPICRKTNSFSQRFRYKDHTAEHMVCEVIAHPCCHGVYGECRITTREYCDFVSGYFHEEASLCSQPKKISQPNNEISVQKEEPSHNGIKLKAFEIKKFDGKLENWLPFRDQFKLAVHENSKLSTAAKFNFLSEALVGKAATTIAGFTSSEKCYNDARALLQEEYGNSDKLVEKCLQKLMSIKLIQSSSDVHGLRQLYNQVTATMRSLTALQIPSSHYEVMVKSVLLKALPSVMRVQFHRSTGRASLSSTLLNTSADNTHNSGSSEAQLKVLLDFIRVELEALEKSLLSERESNRNDDRERKGWHAKVGTATGLFAGSSDKQQQCVFCKKGNHSTKNCKSNLSAEQRKVILRREGRCFRCTNKNHNSKFCKAQWIKCDLCSGRHLTSMCSGQRRSNKAQQTIGPPLMMIRRRRQQRVLLN